MEQKSALSAMQRLETRSDEELEAETRHRSAAQALLGARAAERYDAKASRAHFQKAIAAARPQERMALRRMADASLALAGRRADDLKVAVERLGQEAPSNRQLMLLRLMGLVAPTSGGTLARVRGIAIILGIVIVLLALGFGVASLITLPFGGASVPWRVLLGIIILAVVLAVLAVLGRRRQASAKAKAQAARSGR